MMTKKLNLEEKYEIVITIKKGDYSKLEILLEAFTPYMLKKYRSAFSAKAGVHFKEIKHEYSVEIFESISGFRGGSFGELCKYITRIIDVKTINLFNDYKNNRENHLYTEDLTDAYYTKTLYYDNSIEEKIINRMLNIEAYNKFIKGKIPKCQERAIKIFLSTNGDVKEYLESIDIKFETFRKNFNRGMNTVREIVATEAFRKFYSTSMILISFLWKFTLGESVFYIDQF